MDIKYCSATTTDYFQETITSRISNLTLKVLSILAKPAVKFREITKIIKALVTIPIIWTFYDCWFEIQIHPCFSELHFELIGSVSEGISVGELTEGTQNEEADLTAILQTTIAKEYENSDENRTWLEIQHCPGNPEFVLLKVHMKDNSELWCGLSNIVSNEDGSKNEFFLSPVAFTDEFFLMLCLRCSLENLHSTTSRWGIVNLFGNKTSSGGKDNLDKDDALDEFFIVTREGPAVKLTLIIAEKGLSIQYDCSLSVQCAEWPSIADEFKHRNRLSGFPSLEFVKQLTSKGCLQIGRAHV